MSIAAFTLMQARSVTLLLLIILFRVACGLWTTASLSVARSQLASTALTVDLSLAFFAGGTGSSGNLSLFLFVVAITICFALLHCDR
jgi:hypothetical protein